MSLIENYNVKHAALIWEIHSTEEVMHYVDKNASFFKAYDWVAIANKIEFLIKQTGIPLQADQKALLSKRLWDQTPSAFNVKQLTRYIEFFNRCFPESLFTQVYIKTALEKINDRQEVTIFVQSFGHCFDARNWLIALDIMQELEVRDIGSLVQHHLCKETLGKDSKKLYACLERLGIYFQMDPKLLTTKLKKWPIYSRESLDHFLSFVHEHLPEFNQIHWSVLASRLFQIKGIEANKLSFIVKALVAFKEPWEPGNLAQVIGGFVAFVKNNKALDEMMSNVLGNVVHRLNKQELIMILNAIRNLNEGCTPVYQMVRKIADELFLSAHGIEKLKENLDLFALFVHTCGKIRIIMNFQHIESFILANVDRFSGREALEVIAGLVMREDSGDSRDCVQNVVLEKLIAVLLRELPKIVDVQERGFSIVKAAQNLATLRYLSLEWTQYALQEAQNPQFTIQDKIFLILAFARLGQLSIKVNPEIRQFVNDIAKVYSAPAYELIRSRYPKDGVFLAFSVAILNKTENRELSHRLIEQALSNGPFNDIADQTMLRQAVILTKYPQQVFENIKGDVIESKIQQETFRELQSRMALDERFKSAALSIEVPLLGYTGVDGKIDGLKTLGNKSLLIEVDGPSHRTKNILPGESQKRDLGKTVVKHQIIRDMGMPLVVVRVEDSLNIQKAVDEAFSEILSYIQDSSV